MPWQQRNVTKKEPNGFKQNSITETTEHAWVVILLRPVHLLLPCRTMPEEQIIFRANWIAKSNQLV